ncbi:MAG TPA: L-threonylcarbamoyladenylate synthase [Dehalococcoidia bacterium]|nr:L-threonylcarbamoyladenylate synthase [Dehalococcoidia bacterium]
MPVTSPLPLDDESLSKAIFALAAGKLVILPTDTVYGIAADARRDRAVSAILAAKHRPQSMPVQLLFSPSTDLIGRFAQLSGRVVRIVDALGPGPWTIVTIAAPALRSPATAGGSTIGFRIPDSPHIHRLVERLGGPVAASSANLHGEPSPTTCRDAIRQIGKSCSVALDGGPTEMGRDSTVIDCSGNEVRILREGAVARGEVARILGLRDIPVLRSVR